MKMAKEMTNTRKVVMLNKINSYKVSWCETDSDIHSDAVWTEEIP